MDSIVFSYLVQRAQIAKEFVLVQYIEVRQFIENPQDLPPLQTTIIVVVCSIALLTILYILLFSSRSIWVRLGLKKRVPDWGIVYDSVTKQPLDPALVELRDNVGKRMMSAITDIDGRYGFTGQVSGVYTISASKTNYVFPSKMLAGLKHDGAYSELYFGEPLFLSKDDKVIMKNIPLDPVGFDWNQLAKQQQHVLHSYSRFSVFVRSVVNWYFIGILFITISAFFLLPDPYTFAAFIPLGIFVIVKAFLSLHTATPSYGEVKEKKTGVLLPFALVHIYYAIPSPTPIKYGTKKCDSEGKYYCLVPNGRYYVIIERWNPKREHAEVYTSNQVFTSEPFIVTDGVLSKTFEV